jgi:hypothetical protein
MLNISRALNAGQAQTYHAREFTSAEQNYRKQGDTGLCCINSGWRSSDRAAMIKRRWRRHQTAY